MTTPYEAPGNSAASAEAGLAALARLSATATTAVLLSEGLQLVLDLTGAAAALVVRPDADGSVPVACCGADLDAAAAARLPARPLRYAGHALVLAGSSGPPDGVDAAVELLDSGLARAYAEERLADLAARVDNAQQLAGMGDYDWHIATDTNTWSDQLYRIYGHEPQSFNATYERFLSHIHPDDRDRIAEIHREAYRTGEPYQMIERIVRADGAVRYLSSNGQVIQDAAGAPVRMRGTCIDITELVLAEQERERSVTRFRSLVESCPDAILVFGPDGRVVQANGQAAELFGGDPVGHSVESFWAADARDGLRGIPATGVDGRALQLDVTLAHLDQADAADLVAAFVHNAAPRLASEALAATVREAQVRLRQALEINDNVVQGLTAAAEHLAQGDSASTASYLDATMASARRMMIDLLDPLNGGEVQAGDLVRAAPSSLDGPTRRVVAPPASPDASSKIRVLIVDDYEDMRALLRATLESKGGYEIVGEAADGEEAVRLADALQPDVVVLDLAMPRMDGLQALPLICDSVAGVRVIVLSGFDEAIVAKQALSAGAARFIEKGPRMNLAAAISDVMQAR